MEGAKPYGCHFGPYKTPAKETDPRHPPSNFYFAQEDLLFERRRGSDWTRSAPSAAWSAPEGVTRSQRKVSQASTTRRVPRAQMG
jgi:hypothetical protein